MRGRKVYYVCPFFPEPVKRFTEIAFVNSAIKYSSADSIIDVPTYLGFMRKDWKDRPRVPISIRETAESMEKYAKKVITMDMHSRQIQGVFRIPLDHLDSSVLFAAHINSRPDRQDIVIASPDIGATKRTQKLIGHIGADRMVIVYKLRNVSTGDVSAVDVLGDVAGRSVVFIDDQAVTLGSLCEGAKAVMERGAASVDAYVTHGLNVPDKRGVTAEQRLAESLINKLYITDTIPRPDSYFTANPKIKCISCVSLFAEAIRRDYNDESISELFKTPDNGMNFL